MFKDYYKILDISSYSLLPEIKTAYRAMSKKWHPDRNPDKNVVVMMQDINEAYAILKDECSRKRYDIEYWKFSVCWETKGDNNFKKNDIYKYDYEVQDEKLKESIDAAQELAKRLVKEFLESFQDSFNRAVRGAWDTARYYVYVAVFLFLLGIFVWSVA